MRCYPAFFWKANCKVAISNLLVVKCERWGTLDRKWDVLSLYLHVFSPQGDSDEGLLICGRMLHGIALWGNDSCAYPRKPSIFTKVSTYTNWIKVHIKNNP